jgi:hypothetical protein
MKTSSLARTILIVTALMLTNVHRAHAEECPVRVGEYSGTVKAEWLTKTREMRLLEAFAFKGPDCKVWPVPKGAIVDGASIPQPFWSLIGGPFEGRYRDASVVHDYYCQVRTETWESVHEMFYYAMLANGVDSNKAAAMYYAVRWFGPRWELYRTIRHSDADSPNGVRTIVTEDLKPNSEVIRALATVARQPSPLELGSLARPDFRNRIESGSKPEANPNWLIKDGVSISNTLPLRQLARYSKPREATTADVIVPSTGIQFRLLSISPASPPSQAEIDRIRTWIERDHPSLEALKNTPTDRIP